MYIQSIQRKLYVKKESMKVNLREIEVGDIFSEESHYVVKEVKSESVVFKHLESGKTANLSNEYVYNMLNTSDQYEKEVKVTREDKKDGTPGIRTIFEGIKSSEVFTVVFKKQDKAKTKKQFESEKEAQRMEAISMIDKAKRQKKSMATAYKEALEFVQSNPIKDYTEGEDRVLRGFKIQFVSRDGKYRCMDMDIEKTEKDTGERLVNINTISQLIYNGVKYTVE
jgi:hypothetical protein